MKYITENTWLSNENILNQMQKLIQPKKTDIVLDLGTGAKGNTALKLAPLVKEILTVDNDPKAIENFTKILKGKKEKGLELENIKFRLMPVDQLTTFSSNSFDIVTCRAAFHHFSEPNKILIQINRILKPNGKFEMMDPFFSADVKETWIAITRMKELDLANFYTFQEYIELVLDSGFKIDSVIPFKFPRYYSEWIKTADITMRDRLKNVIEQLPSRITKDELHLEKISREINGEEKEDLIWYYNCFEMLAIKPIKKE